MWGNPELKVVIKVNNICFFFWWLISWRTFSNVSDSILCYYALLLCDHGMYEYGRAELCTERIEGCEVVRVLSSLILRERGQRRARVSWVSEPPLRDRWSEISLRRDHGARGHQTHSLWPFQKWTEQRTCGEINCSNDYHTRHLLKYLSSSLSSSLS